MTDILFYAEDPGAANYLSGLPEACRSFGFSCSLLAEGEAATLFHIRGEVVEKPKGLASEILAETRPKLLVVGTAENRDSLGLSLISEARHLGILTLGAVDAAMCADARFMGRTGNPLGHAPDRILVPDEETRNRFLRLGFDTDGIIMLGHPAFDHAWKERKRLESLSRNAVRSALFKDVEPGRKVLVFAAEISDGLHREDFFRGPDYTLSGRGVSDKRTEIVLEELLDALPKGKDRPYVVLRMHPKNSIDEFTAYKEELDQISASEPLHELLWASDLLVGMTSIVLVEGAILGKKTLSVVPRETEGRNLSTVRSGVTPCVWRREALRGELSRLMNGGQTEPKLPDSMRVRNVKKRIAEVLVDLVRGVAPV